MKVTVTVSRVKSGVTYADTDGSGAEAAAQYLAEAGVFTGAQVAGQYFFEPERTVTRAEFLAMTMDCLGMSATAVTVTGFSDDAAIPAWAKDYASAALRQGVVRGSAGEDGAADKAAVLGDDGDFGSGAQIDDDGWQGVFFRRAHSGTGQIRTQGSGFIDADIEAGFDPGANHNGGDMAIAEDADGNKAESAVVTNKGVPTGLNLEKTEYQGICFLDETGSKIDNLSLFVGEGKKISAALIDAGG